MIGRQQQTNGVLPYRCAVRRQAFGRLYLLLVPSGLGVCSSCVRAMRYELMSILVSPSALRTVCPSQTVNGWLFQAARAPTQLQCENILQTKMKPFKPLAFESLMKRDPKQWAHWAQPLGAAIMDQVTSNGAESTMNMIGPAVRRYAGLCSPPCFSS